MQISLLIQPLKCHFKKAVRHELSSIHRVHRAVLLQLVLKGLHQLNPTNSRQYGAYMSVSKNKLCNGIVPQPYNILSNYN